jgi:SPP1 gp7 family putative phage head morphogenesis protein
MPKKIPNKILDATLKDTILTDRYGVGLNSKIQSLLKSTEDEIVAAIAKIDPTSPTMTKWKQQRLEKLQSQISDIVKTGYKDISSLTSGELTALAKTQAKNVVSKFNNAVGADLFQVTLTPDNVKSIAQNTLIDGATIKDWWNKQSSDTQNRLRKAMAAGTQALQIGMMQGESVGDLIGRIRGTALTPGVMSISKREATALVRTSVMQVANVTRQETYKANADVLDGFEFIATLDSATCPRCRVYDGKKYDMDMQPIGHELPFPGTPVHFNCLIDYQVPVYTLKGWKPIGEIEKGDLVLTHKGRFRKVTKLIFAHSQQPEVVKFSLEGLGWRNNLTITEDHPVMINGKWCPAKDIKSGDKILFLSHKCGRKECQKQIPYFRKYCSFSCRSKEMVPGTWTDERRKSVSIKNSESNLRQYESGLRDAKKGTAAANIKTRQMVADGIHPFQRNDVKENSKKRRHSEKWKTSIHQYMTTRNPSYNPEFVEKQRKSREATMLAHPELHPNVIMAQKGFMSSLEKKMQLVLDNLGIDYIRQCPIGRYFADFAIPDLMIVIEVDGIFWHKDTKDKDLRRQKILEKMGWQVVRYDDNQLSNMLSVQEELNRLFANHEGKYEFTEFEVSVIKKWKVRRPKRLYNFSVEEDESYIVQGFVVHNCRCTTAPITKSWAELAGTDSPLSKKQLGILDSIPVGQRSSMNGQVSGNVTYNEWLKSQPVDIQQEILGPGKFRLWSENKLDMVDLVNNNGSPLTIKELQAKLGTGVTTSRAELVKEAEKIKATNESLVAVDKERVADFIGDCFVME